VVSVTTYRDAGFLPAAFVNFLCLLGWSPKNDREKMSRGELVELFTLDGINRSNATINFTDEDPFDPKAVWLNAEHLRRRTRAAQSRRILSEDRSGRDKLDRNGQTSSSLNGRTSGLPKTS
jgi:glutamyl/glutaminyl-tRNA synthetase